MIVDAFTESLEIGLESPGQVVVSIIAYLIALPLSRTDLSLPRDPFDVAYDPHFRIRMADWSRNWRIPGT